jgi:N-acetylmuramoyl-L-alanine amidase
VHAFFQRVKVVKKTVETKGMNRLLTIMLLFSLALGVGNLHAQNSQQGVKVIVIDAGHGGYFPGARYGGYAEKNINLQMALKLGAMIEKNMPQIKVVYTRKSDKHFSENLRTDLQARADIANNAGGAAGASLNALRVNGPCAAGATQEKFAGLFAIQDFLDIVKTSGLTMVVPGCKGLCGLGVVELAINNFLHSDVLL